MNIQQRTQDTITPASASPEGHFFELAQEYHELLLAAIEDLDNTEFCRTGRRSVRARELRSQVAVLERAVEDTDRNLAFAGMSTSTR
jgi:hypothetical protein